MRKLNPKYILPAASVWASLCCSCLAQVYSTNNIGHVQAIKIAAQLRKGMREEDVNQFMATNKLYSYISVGDNFSWGQFFDLTDNCSLHLDYIGNDWGRQGSSLDAAYIQSNRVDIISVPLAKSSKENPIEKQAEEAKFRDAQYERWLQTNLASGYFQKKTFVLNSWTDSESNQETFFSLYDCEKFPDGRWTLSTFEDTNIIQITASTNDMVIWERIVKEFNTTHKMTSKILPFRTSTAP